MTDHDHPPPTRPLWLRCPLSALITTTALLSAVAVGVALAAPEQRGTAAVQAPIDGPGRLDASQARLARAQSTADRFAVAFARYLSHDTPVQGLRRYGATTDLVARVQATPHRAQIDHGSSSVGYRATSVTAAADRGGWLATSTLTTEPPQTRSAMPATELRVPLTFRLEHRGGRVVVVDLNAGGRE